MPSEYVVLGYDFDDEELRVVTFYDPLAGTTTTSLKEETEFPLRGTREWADDLAYRISIMDAAYWPKVNPILGELDEGTVVVRLEPCSNMTADGKKWVAELAVP